MNAYLFELLSLVAVISGVAAILHMPGYEAEHRAIPIRVRRQR